MPSHRDDDDDDSRLVRRRISKACNYCRQRKIKCNGHSPCANCHNHDTACVYTKTIRKKKRTAVKKLTLQELEKRMNKMEDKLETVSDTLVAILRVLNKNKLTDLKPESLYAVEEEEEEEEESLSDGDEDEDGMSHDSLSHSLSPLSDNSGSHVDEISLTPRDDEMFPLDVNFPLFALNGQLGGAGQMSLNGPGDQLDALDSKLSMAYYPMAQLQEEAVMFQ